MDDSSDTPADGAAGTTPGTMPDPAPSTMPDRTRSTTPSATPHTGPGTTPDTGPGTTPNARPGTTPDSTPQAALIDDILRLISPEPEPQPSPGPALAPAPLSGPPLPRRIVLGLAGPPAAGKSTLAQHLVRAVEARLGPGAAAYVPLDGFHLSNAQLRRIGRLDRKGAPDTFDAWGYAALLARLATERDRDVFVPDYDRTLHEPVAARHVVTPAARLVVTEGNYLAADAPGWRDARRFIDVLWYVDAPDPLREARLFERQRTCGRDDAAARDWVTRSDRPNGEWVKPSRVRCDRILGHVALPDTDDGTAPHA